MWLLFSCQSIVGLKKWTVKPPTSTQVEVHHILQWGSLTNWPKAMDLKWDKVKYTIWNVGCQIYIQNFALPFSTWGNSTHFFCRIMCQKSLGVSLNLRLHHHLTRATASPFQWMRTLQMGHQLSHHNYISPSLECRPPLQRLPPGPTCCSQPPLYRESVGFSVPYRTRPDPQVSGQVCHSCFSTSLCEGHNNDHTKGTTFCTGIKWSLALSFLFTISFLWSKVFFACMFSYKRDHFCLFFSIFHWHFWGRMSFLVWILLSFLHIGISDG